MTRGNPNRPAPNSKISVEPIRKIKDIKAIKKLLKDKPRDYCIFVLGINTNLRASDILNLKVQDVAHAAKEIAIKERKTGKERRITLNKAVKEAIRALLLSSTATDRDLEGYLFKSQRGDVLTVPSLSRLVKSWCKSINLPGNYASHSLRKTWGYHQRVTFGTGIPELMTCFNHATQKETLNYLCIQPEEIKNVYMNEL